MIKNVSYFICRFGSDVTAVDIRKQTPLHLASISGSASLVNQLLLHKSDPNATDSDGFTPIICALLYSRRSEPVVKKLIQSGADITKADSYGRTPLHYAAGLNGSRRICEILIQNKANIEAVDGEGNTPLHLAALYRSTPTAELLVKKKCNVNIRNKEGTRNYN